MLFMILMLLNHPVSTHTAGLMPVLTPDLSRVEHMPVLRPNLAVVERMPVFHSAPPIDHWPNRIWPRP